MEVGSYPNNPPLPTPNLCRLVEILFRNVRRRKLLSAGQDLCHSSEYVRKGHGNSACETPRKSPTDKKDPGDSTTQCFGEGFSRQRDRFEDRGLRFKGKTPSQLTLTELTAEFRALTVAQEHESRRHFEQKSADVSSVPSQWCKLKAGDAEFLALLPSEMRLENGAASIGTDQLGAKNPVFTEQIVSQQKTSAGETRTATTASSPDGSLAEVTPPVRWTVLAQQEAVSRLAGRPFVKADPSPVTATPATLAPSVPTPQLMWVRLPNNQLVLAQVPAPAPGIAAPVHTHLSSSTHPRVAAASTATAAVSPAASPAPLTSETVWVRLPNNQLVLAQVPVPEPGITTPVQTHLRSTPSPVAAVPAAAGSPVSPVHERTSWAKLAAVSPEEHKQMWVRLPNNQLVLAQVPAPALGIAAPVHTHLSSSTHPPVAAASTATAAVSPAASPAPLTSETVWVRLPNNQLVLAQVPVPEPGITTPVQTHLSSTPSPVAAAGSPVSPVHERTSWTKLAAVSPEEHKQMIGERLYPQIQQMYPGLTKKITGMLLELDNKELLRLLGSPEMLRSRVDEAVNVLHDQEPLTTEVFGAHEHKQILGERLFPKVQRLYPEFAGKITGMLLELDNLELLRLLEDHHLLKDRAEEAWALFWAVQHGALQKEKEEISPIRVPGKKSLTNGKETLTSGDPKGTRPPSGNPSRTQSCPSGAQPRDISMVLSLTTEKGPVSEHGLAPQESSEDALGTEDRTEEVLLEAVSLTGNEPSQTVDVSGAGLPWKNAAGKESPTGAVSGTRPVMSDGLGNPLVTGDFPGTKLPTGDVPDDHLLTDSGVEKQTVIDAVPERSQTGGAAETQSMETTPGLRSLNKNGLETEFLTDITYPRKCCPSESDVPKQSRAKNLSGERTLFDDSTTQSLTGNVGSGHAQKQEEQPSSADGLGKQGPAENVLKQRVSGRPLTKQDLSGHQSLTCNIPDSFLLTMDTRGIQPSTNVENVSWEQLQTEDVADTLALLGDTLENTPKALDKQSTNDDDVPLPALPPELQKEDLREQLVAVVERLCPGLGSEVSHILLLKHQDPREIVTMMGNTDTLKSKVGEAVSLLQAQRVQQQWTAAQQEAALLQQQQQQQKQMLGERLFSLIQPAYPKLAVQITGLLMERDSSQLLQMLQWPQLLSHGVGEAVATLQAHLLKGPLNADLLDLFPAAIHKQIIRDRLLPLVQGYHADQAGQITGMLLSLDTWQLLRLLENRQVLEGTVDNTLRLLQQQLGTEAGGGGGGEAEKIGEAPSAKSACKEKDADNNNNDDDDDAKEDEDAVAERMPTHDRNHASADKSSPVSTAASQVEHRDARMPEKKTNVHDFQTDENHLTSPTQPADACSELSAQSQSGNLDSEREDAPHLKSEEVYTSQNEADHAKEGSNSRASSDSKEDDDENARQDPAKPSPGGRSPDSNLVAPSVGTYAAQGGVVRLTPGDLSQCATFAQQGLTPDVFDAIAYIQKQKEMLGERLFSLIQPAYPKLAVQITGLLMERDSSQLLQMLQWPQLLSHGVGEAVATLQAHLLKGPLNADLLDLFPPPVQKQMLGDLLYVHVERLRPDVAPKVTGMLLGLDNTELLHLLNDPRVLAGRVQEAVDLLELRQNASEEAAADPHTHGINSPTCTTEKERDVDIAPEDTPITLSGSEPNSSMAIHTASLGDGDHNED
ncbi:uncharacterized protein LOC143283779 isoform X2 [Babylonia areolata]|uniref:uncharacterized protein LOC143283779 isoform X2 n=1 Tax=Babylonia areolata TaxID=304850 RepID=UPI003FD07932